MKFHYYVLLLFLALSVSLNAQIQYTGCTTTIVAGYPVTLNLSGTVGARNTYISAPASCSAGSCTYRIIYTGSQWELQFSNDNGGSFPIVLYSNTTASTPNPPSLSLGSWVDVSGVGCGSITTLSGDVQNSITVSSAVVPSVATTSATTITSTSAVLGGNVASDGGASVTDRGVVYSSTDTTPQIGETGVVVADNGSGTGTFFENITGLTPSTQYYYASYAINSEGTSYGSILNFATVANTPPAVAVTSAAPIPPTSTQAVTIIADATDANNDALTVQINWGTSSGSLTNVVSMSNTGGDTFSGTIPAQTAGTTVFYNVSVQDPFTTTNSSTASYTVQTSGLQITGSDTNYTIDFDNSVVGINNGAYTGSGLAPQPAAGQLNSGGVVVLGMSNGNTVLGGTYTTTNTDFTRGTASAVVTTGGLYAFNVSNGGTADVALGVKPGSSDFTPGSISIRLQNRTGAAITELSVAYEVLTYDVLTRDNTFNFGHGSDFNSPTAVTDLDFAAPLTVFSNTQWRRNQFQTNITVNIAAGASYYLVWTGNDNTGSGSRPQVALDDIQIVANPSTVVNTIAGEYESITIAGSATAVAGTTVEGFVNVPGGTLTSDGNLTFKSSATRSAILKEVTSGGTVAGDVTVEQFYPANRAFRFVNSPVRSNGVTSVYSSWQEGGSNTPGFGTHITGGAASGGFDQNLNGNPSAFLYDASGILGASGWSSLGAVNLAPNQFPLVPTIAFRMMIRGDRTVSLTQAGVTPTNTRLRSTGTLVVGDFTFTGNPNVSELPFGSDGSFYFMPNMYQAQLDLSQTLNSTNSEDIITTRYYAWQPVTENYVTYDFASGGVQNGVTNLVQPGQAFFIQTDEASGTTAGYLPTVTFRESQKSNSTFTTATYSQPEASYEIKLFDQALLGGSIANDFVRGFINTGSNNAIDNQDASKIRGLREQLFVMSNGQELSIERRDHFADQEIIDLNMTNMQTGTYTFELNFNGLVNTNIQLVDQYLGTSTVINQGAIETYSFDVDESIPGSMDQNRFYIEFTTGTLSSGDVAFAKAVQLYPNPVATDILNITGMQTGEISVTITNLLGQQVSQITKNVSGNTTQVSGFDNLNSGVYLVTLSQEGQSVTKRVVVE